VALSVMRSVALWGMRYGVFWAAARVRRSSRWSHARPCCRSPGKWGSNAAPSSPPRGRRRA